MKKKFIEWCRTHKVKCNKAEDDWGFLDSGTQAIYHLFQHYMADCQPKTLTKEKVSDRSGFQ